MSLRWHFYFRLNVGKIQGARIHHRVLAPLKQDKVEIKPSVKYISSFQLFAVLCAVLKPNADAEQTYQNNLSKLDVYRISEWNSTRRRSRSFDNGARNATRKKRKTISISAHPATTITITLTHEKQHVSIGNGDCKKE